MRGSTAELAGSLLALIALWPGAGRAQTVPRGINPDRPLADLVLTPWTTEEGLPTNVLLDVQQTSAGDLWVAGFGGLARFDGIGFEVFNQMKTPELPASSFYRVLEDGPRLWIASQTHGVWKFENERLTPLFPDQPRASIRALLVDRSGTLWVGTADHGVFRVDDGTAVAIAYTGLSQVSVRAIVEDHDGALWFGTEGKGLVRLAEGRFDTFGAASGLRHGVTSLWKAAAGGLWIGTENGLIRLVGDTMTAVPELEGVEVFGVREDDYGSLWVAAEQGLFRRRSTAPTFEHLATLQGHSLRSINTIAFDHEGSAWIASYTSGLFQLREGKFRNLTTDDKLTSRRVNALFGWSDGRVLVGGDLGAIDVIDRGEVSRLDLQDSLPEVRVRDFFEDRSGTLWISSYAGLLRIRDGEETLLTTESGLPANLVRRVYEDSRGALWIATRSGGLARQLESGGFEVIDRSAGLASNFILSLGEDASGRLLVGTQAGLSVLGADGKITNYTTDEGLPGELVFNTHVDDDGAIWIATTGGLARLFEGRITALTTRNGLPTSAIYDYQEDAHGAAWMSSSLGLIRVRRTELEELLAGERERIEPEVFDRTDGMAEQQCTGATRMLVTSTGDLWVPTLGGISIIDPGDIAGNPVPPPIVIRRLTVDGEEIVPPGPGATIEIAPGHRRFTFSFAALSFQAPEKVTIRYRLEGFDEEWIDAGLERTALYTGLPPGRFSFRVIAANNDGVWNEDEARLRFRVRPHYYQTPYFFLLLAVVLVVAPWGVYRWRVNLADRRSRELEGLLAEQTRLEGERTLLIRELESRNEQLEQLTYAVSHDLKSPLFTIQGFLGLLDEDRLAGDEKRVEADLQRIREAVVSMNRILDELLEMWRMESTESRLEESDLGDLVRQAIAGARGRLADREVEIVISAELPRVRVDRTKMMEVFQNLLDNAARFMGDQPRPKVEIACRQDGDERVIFVRDNGIGIDPRFHRKVFQIFARLNRTHDGTGLGLAIVKRVIETHGGRVWVESEGAGEGSTFCFTLGPATEIG